MWHTQPLQVIPPDPTGAQNRVIRMPDSPQNSGGCSSGQKPYYPSSSNDLLRSCPSWLLVLGKHHCGESSKETQAKAELGTCTQFPDFFMAQDSRAPPQVYFPEIIVRGKFHNEKAFGHQLFLHPKPATVKGRR